jgi:hypothetical protein
LNSKQLSRNACCDWDWGTMEIASGQRVGASRLHTPEARRKAGRSRIANDGGAMLPTTDGRSLWARIRRDTYRAIVAMLRVIPRPILSRILAISTCSNAASGGNVLQKLIGGKADIPTLTAPGS